TRLQQILNNLIENAIKFTPKGKIEFGLNIEQNVLKFYVRDTGLGISAEAQPKIFERLWQNYTVSDKFPKGTGLGLSLSKKLAILMKGDISFTSEQNKGSEFVLQIPYIPADETIYQKSNWDNQISSAKVLDILVVEDDAINTLYLQELLKRYKNCNADYVGDGYAAFDMLKTKKYDILLLDIQLPNIDGYEVARRVRKTDKNIKIIAQTAYAMPEDYKKCLLAGCDDYISKPINVNELVAVLNKYSKKEK
ncbi:MAG: response regulator, partial [Bacteroidales bacterium]|nr:response regulator [Bacteroidales bacterium]